MSERHPNGTDATPWHQLTPEAALEDSPFFRAALHQVEDDLEIAGKWLDGFVKNLRSALELSLSKQWPMCRSVY
jgi:hypothetical protein